MKANISFLLAVYCLGAFQASDPRANAQTEVVVWGDNTQTNVPPDLTNAVAIAAGVGHCLALRNDGTVVAWGAPDVTNVPLQLTNAVAVAAGLYFSLALRNDGTVIGWGYDTYGQIDVPADLTNAVAVAAGFEFSMALRNDGTVVVWGNNDTGQTNVPANLTNVAAIAAGNDFCLALRNDGSVVGWGSDQNGETDAPANLTNAVAIAAGDFSMALRSDGTIVLWGSSYDPVDGVTNVPTSLSNVESIAVGCNAVFAMALKKNGSVAAWGNNTSGETAVPPHLPFAQAIAAGGECEMALLNPTQISVPPTIYMQPVTQTLAAGSTGVFRVRNVGFAPFSYQWYFNETNAIVGATNASLTITNLQVQQSGTYTVVISNSAGSTISQPASLNVLPAVSTSFIPAITLYGGVGFSYQVQYITVIGPTNAPWNTIATVKLTNSPQFFPDYSAIGQPARFYRTVQLP